MVASKKIIFLVFVYVEEEEWKIVSEVVEREKNIIRIKWEEEKLREEFESSSSCVLECVESPSSVKGETSK